jgi:hypothetical protein
MTLSSLNECLTPDHLYPDRVVIMYRYNIPPCSQQTFAAVLSGYGFRTSRRFHGMHANLDLGEGSNPVMVAVSRAGPTVGFSVPINVLTLLHQSETRDFGDEFCSSGAENWLHPDAFENSDPVWQRLYGQVIEHETQMEQLANEIASAANPAGIATLQHMRVNSIEVCADFAARDPHAVLRTMLPRFKERFSRVRFQRYGELASARWYGELYHDCNSIRGYRSAGISVKLYEKTNRRIRIEVEYERAVLSRLQAPINLVTEDEIGPLRQFLSQRCLPEMNHILERARAIPIDHWSVFRLISCVAPLFSRNEPEELERLLRALTLNCRITSQTLPYRKLAQLRRAGVLVSTGWGLYGIAPECQNALRILRSADVVCQRTLARAAEAAASEDAELPEAAE